MCDNSKQTNLCQQHLRINPEECSDSLNMFTWASVWANMREVLLILNLIRGVCIINQVHIDKQTNQPQVVLPTKSVILNASNADMGHVSQRDFIVLVD